MGKNAALLLILIFLAASCVIIVKPAFSSTDAAENTWVTKAPMHVTKAGLDVAVLNNSELQSQNSNLNPASNIPPVLLWNFTTSNGVWSSPTIDKGVLYVGCEDPVYTGTEVSYAGNLYALNALNGDLLWNYPAPVGGSSPVVADGAVYVGSFDGNIYAFNATNGIKLWSYGVGDLASSSPAYSEGIVYIGLSNWNLIALNSTTGEEVWKHQSSGAVSSPIVKEGMVFAASTAFLSEYAIIGEVYALNASNGKTFWRYSFNNSVSFPTIVGETLYVGVGSNLTALETVNGSQLWSISVGNQDISLNPTVLRVDNVFDGVLFVSSNGGIVYALNASNGEKIWNRSLGSQIETPPTAADGVVYVSANDGNLYALNAANGEILWSYPVSDTSHALESSPVVVDGIIYIGSGTRNICALSSKSTSSSPFNNLPIIIVASVASIVFVIAVFILFRKRLQTRSKVTNTKCCSSSPSSQPEKHR